MNVFMLLFSGDHVFAIHYGSLYSCFHEFLGHSFPHICHVVFACLTILQKQFFAHFEVFAEMLFLRCKLKRHQKCACVNCIYVRYKLVVAILNGTHLQILLFPSLLNLKTDIIIQAF